MVLRTDDGRTDGHRVIGQT